MNFGCLAFAMLIAFAGVARSEGAYVLNSEGGGSILPADCKGFTTVVSDNHTISKRVSYGTLTWTSDYKVETMPDRACRMGFPLCVMHAGATSEIGNGYVVITEAGDAKLTCQGYPVFER